ncbi:putative nuclease HARBI1 [Rhopilema esculentum]|uniref:putative nuclease HARBI1 n=1 Tax=Rhopilema esculentum TaxID=499914 RepID=UPI0031CF2EA5
MSPERFQHLLTLVGPRLGKKKCRSRQIISPSERLVITLRYLATGDSQQSHSFNFRVGKATVCHIIRDTCKALWTELHAKYLNAPDTEEDWKEIARGFEREWNFPHCIGALDGKHVAMECPKNQGSNFFNYKAFHSIVLMTVCDANYCFTIVDIGGYGGDNDASIFGGSEMGMAFKEGEMDIPKPDTTDGLTLPYVLVSDELFKLEPWLMKPFPGQNLDVGKMIYNYRLSRCRRTIENAFGILAARWRILRRSIRASVSTVENITKACVCLQNYLMQTDNAFYAPKGFVDAEDNSGNLIPGTWRSLVEKDQSALKPVKRAGSNNYTINAKLIRETFKNYFISEPGSVSWQLQNVTSCGKKN